MDESSRSVAGARKGGKQGSSNEFRAEVHVRVFFPTPHFVDEELIQVTEVAPAPTLLPGSMRSPRVGGMKLGYFMKHSIKHGPPFSTKFPPSRRKGEGRKGGGERKYGSVDD